MKSNKRLKKEIKLLKFTLKEILINPSCRCGGWACPRCQVSLDEALKLLPKDFAKVIASEAKYNSQFEKE